MKMFLRYWYGQLLAPTPAALDTTEDVAAEEVNEDTIEIAVKQAYESGRVLDAWYDHADGKVATVFGISSLIIGVVPTLSNLMEGGAALWFWGAAVGFWLVAVAACFVAFSPANYTLTPSPRKLYDLRWLGMERRFYNYYMLRYLARSFAMNRDQYLRKVSALSWAIGATVAEVLALTVALVLS
jgi:hypothetical protein